MMAHSSHRLFMARQCDQIFATLQKSLSQNIPVAMEAGMRIVT